MDASGPFQRTVTVMAGFLFKDEILEDPVGPVLYAGLHLPLQEGPGRVELGEPGDALALLSGQLLRSQGQREEVGFGEQGDAAGRMHPVKRRAHLFCSASVAP